MLKKLSAFLLAVILIILSAAFISCDNKISGGSDTNSSASNDINQAVSGENATESETMSEKVTPDLPDKTYDGYEFTFLLKGPNYNEWASMDIASEGENGDIINDSIYRRNTYVEDKYDVKIAWNLNNDPNTAYKKTFNAGDSTYDIFMPDLPSASQIAQQGMFYDMKKMPYTDLSAIWWDQQAVKELSIGGKLYYCTGDLSFTAIDTIWIMMFNKSLIKQYGLEDPYSVVKNGDWTYDKLEEMIKGVSKDLNNDGKIDENDLVGFVSPSDRYVRAMILSGGESFTEKTSDDYFNFKSPDSKFIEIYDRTMQFMHDNPDVLDVNNIKDQGTDYQTNKYFLAKTMFQENRVLFFSEVMQNMVRLRQMDTDFGVIPLPKYSKDQTVVPHYVFVDTTTVAAVPANAPDIERTSTILEALTAESTYTVIPAYYDVSLKTKLARDEQSGEMMDLIRASRTYDLASVYDFGGIYEAITNAIIQNKVGYQSAIDKIQGKIDTGIVKIVNQYKSLE
ncbi:MAG: extracellular solute-binding protein [Oscillospiraceae bacterium]|nr:extracellular solute-binding protein [Oscillospiraceae bacterium]